MANAEDRRIPASEDEPRFMHNPGDWYWKAEPTIAEPEQTAHYIVRTVEDETPAGSDCEEYYAACGNWAASWFSPSMGVPEKHFSSSLPSDIQICDTCHQEYLHDMGSKEQIAEPDIVTHLATVKGIGDAFTSYARHESGRVSMREFSGGPSPFAHNPITLSDEEVEKLSLLELEWRDVEAINRHAHGLELTDEQKKLIHPALLRGNDAE